MKLVDIQWWKRIQLFFVTSTYETINDSNAYYTVEKKRLNGVTYVMGIESQW